MKGAADFISSSSFGALTVVKYLGIEDDLEVSDLNLDIIAAYLNSLGKSQELCKPYWLKLIIPIS